jgi:hypothetical protein
VVFVIHGEGRRQETEEGIRDPEAGRQKPEVRRQNDKTETTFADTTNFRFTILTSVF